MNGDFLLNLSPFALLPPLRMYLLYLVEQGIEIRSLTQTVQTLKMHYQFQTYSRYTWSLARAIFRSGKNQDEPNPEYLSH